jgi:hypothetical protein
VEVQERVEVFAAVGVEAISMAAVDARALVVVTLMITLGLALRPVATDLWTLVVGAWAV